MAIAAGSSPRRYFQPPACDSGGASSSPTGENHSWRIDIPDGDPNADWFYTPRRSRDGVLRCLVLLQKEKDQLEMVTEEGHVFMLSAKRIGKDWIISHERGCPEKTVIAQLRAHEKSAFTCGRHRLVGSAPQRSESLYVRHHTMALSKHLPELNAMQVHAAPGRPQPAAKRALTRSPRRWHSRARKARRA